jgi:hypothetical protein
MGSGKTGVAALAGTRTGGAHAAHLAPNLFAVTLRAPNRLVFAGKYQFFKTRLAFIASILVYRHPTPPLIFPAFRRTILCGLRLQTQGFKDILQIESLNTFGSVLQTLARRMGYGTICRSRALLRRLS